LPRAAEIGAASESPAFVVEPRAEGKMLEALVAPVFAPASRYFARQA
jgi:hypothetical protein